MAPEEGKTTMETPTTPTNLSELYALPTDEQAKAALAEIWRLIDESQKRTRKNFETIDRLREETREIKEESWQIREETRQINTRIEEKMSRNA